MKNKNYEEVSVNSSGLEYKLVRSSSLREQLEGVDVKSLAGIIDSKVKGVLPIFQKTMFLYGKARFFEIQRAEVGSKHR